MNSKYYKKNRRITMPIFSLMLTIAILIGTFPLAAFSMSEYEDSSIYEETHDQINFDNLSVYVINKDSLVVDVDPTTSLLDRIDAIQQKKKFDIYSKEHPKEVAELRNAINSSEHISAISYTDAPVVYVDNHYERVTKKNISNMPLFATKATAANQKTSTASTRYRLTLQTQISRSGSSNPYKYTAITTGSWSNSISIFSGEKKPAGGNDFILQACPTVTSRTTFSSEYNYSTHGKKVGQEGVNYFLTDGGDSWVKYEVVDDPVGIAQLKKFKCTQTFTARKTSSTKKINSYYIHTWKSMSLSVTVSGTAGKSGGTPAASVGLSFTPGIQSKQWQLYNFVSYNW